MITAPLLLITLASVFQSSSPQQAPTPQTPPERKVRIEIVTTENGETKRVTREFDANDEAQLRDVLRELGVLDHMRVDADGDNVTIDIRRFSDDADDTDMALTIAPIAPLSPLSPMAPFPPCEKHAFLGVVTNELNDELRAKAKSALKEGAYVVEVNEDTPAAKAGLKAGDIITAVDGDAVSGPDELSEAIREHEAGDKVKIGYERDGKKNTATAELEERSDMDGFAYAYNFDPEHGSEGWDWDSYYGDTPGASETRAFLGVSPADGDDDGSGAAIGDVTEGSAAATMGIHEGDVIRSVNGTTTPDFSTLSKTIRAMKPGDAVSVVLARNGNAMTLTGTLGETEDMVRTFSMNGMPGTYQFNMEGLGPQEQDELRREMDDLRREMDELRREFGKDMRSEMHVTIESRSLTAEEKALLAGKGVTGLDNELQLGDMRAFPNPSNGFFRVQFDIPERGDLAVDVHDAGGEKVYQERIIGSKGRYERTLDLTDKATGTYFLVITQGGKTATRKLVKE
ncbi:MAG: PDZ domain-containing protein [Flavobacteriales bacterium]